MRRVLLTTLLSLSVFLLLACDAEQHSPVAQLPTLTPTPPSVDIAPVKLQSLAAARAAVSFPLLIPAAVPSGFALDTIEHFVNTGPQTPQLERLRVQYRSSDGRYLLSEQGQPMTLDEGAYRFAPTDQKGTVTVQGQPAVWVRGQARMNSQGQPQWEPGPLALRWRTEFVGTAGNYLGYALESDGLTLEELVAIANSVRAYP